MSTEANQVKVENNESAQRFEAIVEGHLAKIDYRYGKNRIIFIHTEVPEELSGRGLANTLAKYALDYARDHNLKVVPLCPFVASYIKRHPEYEPMVEEY